MYKTDILKLVKSINSKQQEIITNKAILNNLLVEKENKLTRNYNRFKERFESIDKEEKRLKSLFDNKYFKYIKLYDFLNENDVYQIKNFQINTELGCLNMNPESIITVNYSDKKLSIDKKSIIYVFNSKRIINCLEFSFYSNETKLPLRPSKIILKYDNHIDNFTESYFRYFNSNNTTDFISKYIFEPKQIKEIIFYFDEEVIYSNAYTKFQSIQYKNDNELKMLIDNSYKLNNFNIYKTSNEMFKKFIFSFSEDNENFKEINFTQNEGLISLNNKNNFILKITVSDDVVKKQDDIEIKTSVVDSNNIKVGNGIYNIPTDNITIESIKITFPISSSSVLKQKLNELSLTESEHFFASRGIYTLNQNHIKNISETNKGELELLKLFDNESILKDNNKALDFYFDKENNKFYTSSFLDKYNFYLTYQYKEKIEKISDDYYTPMLFDFSLKG